MADILNRFPSKILEPIIKIAEEVRKADGQALIVGGAVRDSLIDVEATEIDMEIRGIEPASLRILLARNHGLDEYGKSFGILKLKGLPIEIALPRTEIKVASGHRGFDVEVDPHLPFPEAAARRDFTINAMGMNPLSGEVLDPHGGQRDLEKRILRHIGPAFTEDPLRVLRGMHFVARLNLHPDEETIALCKTIGIEEIPPERIFEEWKKLLL